MKTYLVIASSLLLASPLALAQGLPPSADPDVPATPAEPATPATPAVPAQPDGKDRKRTPEARAGAKSSGNVADFAAFDANGDGKLSREEARGDAGIDFTAMDRDKDGSVSRGEYESSQRVKSKDSPQESKRRR